MSTTRLIPLHVGKGRSAGTAISDIIDYVSNPDKTEHGKLITSYQCNSKLADSEFFFSRSSTSRKPAECAAQTM